MRSADARAIEASLGGGTNGDADEAEDGDPDLEEEWDPVGTL